MSDDLQKLESRRTGSTKKPVPVIFYKGVWLSPKGPQDANEKKIYAEAARTFGAERLPTHPNDPN